MSVAIPKGYKQTKVGVIPEDWDVVAFDDLRDKSDRYSITGGPFGSNLKSEHYTKSGVRIIQLQNIGDGNFINNDFIYTSEEKADELNSCLIYPNDIILAKMAEPVARACMIPNFEKKFLMSSDGIRLHVDKLKYDNKFILESINYRQFRNIAIARSTGSTRQRIGLSDLKSILVVIPPLKEQQKIAQILTIWNDAIIKQEALIKAKEQHKKGLRQKLLSGEIRFDGFSDKWEEVRFKNVFERVTRKNTINNTNVLTISAQHGLINQEDFFNKSVSSKDLSGYILLKKGEFAYNKSYSKGYPMGAIKRLSKYEQGVLSNLYIYFKIKDDNADFYEHYFEAGLLNKEIYKIAQEGARNHGLLNMSVVEFFNDIHILKPSINEQEKIAEVLTQADKEIDLLKNELEALKEQKRGLLQKLLTGKVRVKV